MCAIGPEFHEFIKKLDENDGKLPSSFSPRSNRPDFEYNNSTCHLCNGYYGPSFGEPVCVTCHAFLYPDIPQLVPSAYTFSEKTDDGDSGNDEPSEMLYNDRFKPIHLGLLNWNFFHAKSLESETSPEDEVSRASNSSASGSNAAPLINNPANANNHISSGNNFGPSSCNPVPSCSNYDPSGGNPVSSGSSYCPSGNKPVPGSNYGESGNPIPSSSNSGQNATNPIPSSSNIGQSGNKPIPSSSNFDQCGNNQIPSSSNYGQSCNKPIPSSSNFSQTGNNPIPSSSNFGQSGNKPIPSTSNFVQSGKNPIPSSSNFAQSGNNPIPSSSNFGQSGMKPSTRNFGPSGSSKNGHGANKAGPVDDVLVPPARPAINNHEPEQLPPILARSLAALSTPRLPDNLAPGLVEQLPSEVLLCIFSYLDDLSLSACALVCARWWQLVRARVSPLQWRRFAARRWPLFQPLVRINDWHKKYQSLVESCFCRYCVVQMCAQWQPPYEENAWRRNRLRNELKMLRNDPPEGCAATPLDPKCCHWQAMVTGPAGSPYEGGIFYLYIQVPYSYPMSPPVVRFLTRILHPNVSRHGDLGIDSVHHNWSLALTISKVLISIQSLLTDPYTAVCMEPEVGDMYVNDRARFETLARRWTWRYAMHDVCVNS